MRERPVVTVPYARHDERWAAYMPRAVALGLRSQLAVRLFFDDHGTRGGLNLYSTSRDTLDEEAAPMADLFAAHAAARSSGPVRSLSSTPHWSRARSSARRSVS
jgi:hypothetical protein